MPSLPILLVAFAGIGVAAQAPTNAALARASGSVILAALISFAVGTAILASVWLAVDRTPPSALRGAPWWAWAGGLYGAGFVTVLAYAAPRLGLATTLTIAIASQLTAALILDRFGLLGLTAIALSPARTGGVVLVLAGALLLRRG